MKKIALSFTIIICSLLMQAQEPISYTGIITVDSATKQQLYNRANQWFVKTYVSANDVIQMDDDDNGVIIGKGIWSLDGSKKYYYANGSLKHTIQLYFKEGRCKYVITQLIHEAVPSPQANTSMGLITDADTFTGFVSLYAGKGMKKKMWDGVKRAAEDNVALTVLSLTEALSTETVYENDDW